MALAYTKAGREEQAQLILAALPGFHDEVALKSGLSMHIIKRRMREWTRVTDPKLRRCHIGHWERPLPTGGKYRPYYVAGPGKNAVCAFEALTPTEIQQRYRDNRKGTERADLKRARDRSYHWIKKAAARGDPLINAFFGVRKPSTTPQRENP